MKTNPNDTINNVYLNTDFNKEFVKGDFTGLTKREYFAALCMSGILARKEAYDTSFEKISIAAVNIADALIVELNKENKL